MTDDEIKQFYDCLLKEDDIKIKTSMMLFITTGFRRGEVAGLEWGDVDFENNRISVNKSVLYTEGFGVDEKDPKTIKSTRTISVPDMLINQLKEYKEWQDKYKASLGDKYKNLNKIFSGDFGGLINPDRLDKWLLRFQAKHGLPHYTLHSLRHTNIALQIAASAPEVVSREDVPAQRIEKEREILKAEALNEGKPEKIIDKIVEGGINKLYGDICLLEQNFIKDPSKKVLDVINEAIIKIGEKITVRRFVRYEMGEGLEKRQDDFASEVMSQMKK